MKAYNKKTRMEKARAFVRNECRALVELADLVFLSNLHKGAHFGCNRLERFYRGFHHTYEYYKLRYLTSDDSIFCGERIDTDVLKMHIRDIGFDYDALADYGFQDNTRGGVYSDTAPLTYNRAVVMREAIPVMEHFNLVSLVTLHDIEGYGTDRLTRIFLPFQGEYNDYKRLYLAADPSTIQPEITKPCEITQNLKNQLLDIGFDYYAIVGEIMEECEKEK